MTCFHCGKTGHTAFECRLLSQPQTSLGAAAWAQRNVRLGANKPYDVTAYQKGREANSASKARPSTPAAASAASSSSAAASTNKEKGKRLYKQGKRVRTALPNKTASSTSKDDAKDAEEISD
jgi:hypothetical protein